MAKKMEESKKKGWGGARRGAGRKSKGVDIVTFAFRLERALLDRIGEEARESGRTRAQVIIDALEGYFAEK